MSGSNGFSASFSSSAPSTPGHVPVSDSDNNYGWSAFTYADNPSTTPAGPPPSSTNSFTPAGQPPSSLFGSSQLGTGNLFSQQKSRLGSNLVFHQNADHPESEASQPWKPSSTPFGSNASFPYKESSTAFSTFGKTGQIRKTSSKSRGAPTSKIANPRKLSSTPFKNSPKPRHHRNNTFTVPSSSLRSSLASDASSASDADIEAGSERDSGENEQEGIMEADHNEDNSSLGEDSIMDFGAEITHPTGRNNQSKYASFGDGQTIQRGLVDGGLDGNMRNHKSSRRKNAHLGKKKVSVISTLAKNLADDMGPSALDEPDDLILETDEIIGRIYADGSAAHQQQQFESALITVPEALCKLWQSCCNREKQDSPKEGEFTTGIGPHENASSLQKSNFLSSLLLHLHHPPPASGRQALVESRTGRSMFSTGPLVAAKSPKPYPQILLEWLEAHHNPYQTALANLHTHYPNSTANHNFWDIVFSSTLRGKLLDVIKIFKEADFKYARTARDDGQSEDGYGGLQLENTARVVHRAIQLLETCPAIVDGNWEVTGNDWMVFRKRIEATMSDLASFAEGRDKDLDPIKPSFEAEHFGIRSTASVLSRSARKAESMVPWSIYQNLKAFYSIMLGGTTEILSSAQDWVEATMGLTVWWDGSDVDENLANGLSVSRRLMRRSQSHTLRFVDVERKAIYLHRLAFAFERVTDNQDDDSFHINPSNPVEVGLAAIFEGNIKSFIDLLRKWSMTITTAIVEVAASGGWLDLFTEPPFSGAFNESDLMVLSYHQPKKCLTKDAILVEYANMLFEKESLEDIKAEVMREGWEISMRVLMRLHDHSSADKYVQELLDKLTLQSDSRADKMIDICRAFGLNAKAAEISEKYADFTVDSSDRYGTAMIYYARAHSSKKLKDVLDLLVSFSLVRSLAYPPDQAVDAHLRDIISAPRESLSTLFDEDPIATLILQTSLSGYATLRDFYNLRDEEAYLSPGERASLRPIARTRAAATALITVIASAADNINGGLYDEQSGAVIQVDGLLALLGEALVFVDQRTRVLTLPQIFSLLKVIEDLQTVGPRIYSQCEECFRATMAASHGTQHPPSAREMMKKSVSSLTANSGFLLLGSCMLDDGIDSSMGSNLLTNGDSGASGQEDGEKRGWDWRKGMSRDAKGEDVLRILRLGLAREVARAWMVGDEV